MKKGDNNDNNVIYATLPVDLCSGITISDTSNEDLSNKQFVVRVILKESLMDPETTVYVLSFYYLSIITFKSIYMYCILEIKVYLQVKLFQIYYLIFVF